MHEERNATHFFLSMSGTDLLLSALSTITCGRAARQGMLALGREDGAPCTHGDPVGVLLPDAGGFGLALLCRQRKRRVLTSAP